MESPGKDWWGGFSALYGTLAELEEVVVLHAGDAELRREKYAVQRLGGVLGIFGDEPPPQAIMLRLDPCE